MVQLGSYFYKRSDYDDQVRRKWVKYIDFVLPRVLQVIFQKRITLIGGPLRNLNKITVINSNHWHNLDQLILMTLLPLDQLSSISTLIGTSAFDKKILELIQALYTGPRFLQECQTKLGKLQDRTYNTFVLTFFEGIALNHSQLCWQEYLNRPKYLAFQVLTQQFPGQEFYDLDLVYQCKGRPLDPKDKWFIWKLLDPQTHLTVNVKKYVYPSTNSANTFLDGLYEQKWQNIQQILK
jgi:hypothetical protein